MLACLRLFCDRHSSAWNCDRSSDCVGVCSFVVTIEIWKSRPFSDGFFYTLNTSQSKSESVCLPELACQQELVCQSSSPVKSSPIKLHASPPNGASSHLLVCKPISYTVMSLTGVLENISILL